MTRNKAARPSSSRRVPARSGPAVVLTHVTHDGSVQMVDVAAKALTAREAIAAGHVTVNATARRLVRQGQIKKGNPLEVARVAGILAAKRTAEIIPLCHSLPLSHVAIAITPVKDGYRITATVRTTAQTGVEMEALTAVSAAALTVYDMLKAVDREMVIGDVCLLEKRGGRRGHYKRML
jgi:cyclic pyranopterin monophosphate synthase